MYEVTKYPKLNYNFLNKIMSILSKNNHIEYIDFIKKKMSRTDQNIRFILPKFIHLAINFISKLTFKKLIYVVETIVQIIYSNKCSENRRINTQVFTYSRNIH